MNPDDLFPAEEEEEFVRPVDNRCTPEKLRAFMIGLGRQPTLKECRERFGGILGPMIDGWELQRRGEWPVFEKDG